RLTIASLDHSEPPTTCPIAGHYTSLTFMAALADGSFFVGLTTAKDAQTVTDRILLYDRNCHLLRVVLDGERVTVAPSVGDDRLLAATMDAAGDFLEIDRDGVQYPIDIASPPDVDELIGMRADGAIVVIEEFPTWQLLRGGPSHPPVEIANGRGRTAIVFP